MIHEVHPGPPTSEASMRREVAGAGEGTRRIIPPFVALGVLRGSLLPELLLLVLFWLTRLHALLALPPFFDEAVHVRWAKLVWALQPFHAASDGRLLNIWAYAAFFPFGEALWIARAVTVLAGALGFAAMLGLGQRLFSRRAARLAGLATLALPWAFFYERMALADSFSTPWVPLALLLSILALRPGARRGWLPWLAGAALAALTLTKLTNLLFVPIPLAAWLFCAAPGARRHGLKNVALAYLGAVLIVGIVVVGLKGLAHSDLGFDLIAARTQPAPLGERLARNAGALGSYARAYLTWPLLALFVVGLAATAARRRALALAAILALPVGALLAGSNISESRFLAPVLPLAALLAGAGASRLLEWTPARLRGAAAVIGLGAVLAGGPARFLWLAWYDPGALPLNSWDRYQYVEEWPAGFGLRQAARLIFGPGAERPLDVVVSDEGHIPQLSLYAPWEPGLHRLYGFDDGGVRLLHLPCGARDPYAGLADPARAVLYVVEVPRFQAERDALAATKTLLARFPRPGGQSVIEVYRLEADR